MMHFRVAEKLQMTSLNIPSFKSWVYNLLVTSSTPCRLKMIFIFFIWINLSVVQSAVIESHSKDIRIDPFHIVMSSTSKRNLVCTNYQPTNLPLEANIVESISSNQVKLTPLSSNLSSLNVQIETFNYIGYFHLLCYEKGYQMYGNIADIYTTADPGTLQRTEFCEVFENQYITCKILARNIATAIKNHYEPKFEFKEIHHPSDPPAYIGQPEFLKNESTYEYLVFKWRPTQDGVFPKGVWMDMTQSLKNFRPSNYSFQMFPLFRVTPKYTLKNVSSNEVLINLAPTSSAAYCEKSILPLSKTLANKAWTPIESGSDSIRLDNLLSNTIYRVCIKCKQVFSDPDGLEVCQDNRTPSNPRYFIAIIVGLTVVFLFIFIIVIVWMKKQGFFKPSPKRIKNPHRTIVLNRYDLDSRSASVEDVPLKFEEESSGNLHTLDSSESADASQTSYLPLPTIEDIIEAATPKELP